MRRLPPVGIAAQPRREKCSKSGQGREIHARAEPHRHQAAGGLVEHPDRQLQPAVKMRRATGAQHRPRRPLDHLMNANMAPSPGMPWVDDLALVPMLGLVGVPSLACTKHRPHTSLRMRTPAAFAAARPFVRRQRPPALELGGSSSPDAVAALTPAMLSPAHGFPNAWPYERGRVTGSPPAGRGVIYDVQVGPGAAGARPARRRALAHGRSPPRPWQ